MRRDIDHQESRQLLFRVGEGPILDLHSAVYHAQGGGGFPAPWRVAADVDTATSAL